MDTLPKYNDMQVGTVMYNLKKYHKHSHSPSAEDASNSVALKVKKIFWCALFCVAVVDNANLCCFG